MAWLYPKIIVVVERDYFQNSKSSDEFQHQAVYDLLFEVCAIFMYSLPHLSKTYTVRITVLCLARASHTSNFQSSLFPFLVPYLLGLIHIALMGSIYTTIAGGLFKILSSLFIFHFWWCFCVQLWFWIKYKLHPNNLGRGKIKDGQN